MTGAVPLYKHRAAAAQIAQVRRWLPSGYHEAGYAGEGLDCSTPSAVAMGRRTGRGSSGHGRMLATNRLRKLEGKPAAQTEKLITEQSDPVSTKKKKKGKH